ncbi:DUF4145 domain-containing protein [Streptomyces atratus]|uniref:DUF4145 domain-containing protein n=1 Tax=Streptomyces atratus TaxID=1893 RepID=A0A1K2E9X1_STRAR|nr:DUF4145 domain-containing protein [Streptomyces atratus]SFY32495.1 protein of unknown function [Streptomyces atratus]
MTFVVTMGSPRPPSSTGTAHRDQFREAAIAECHSACRLAGVGFRAVVEAICKDRGATGKNIKARIDNLAQVANLPQDLLYGLHKARIVGNDSIHDGVAYARR